MIYPAYIACTAIQILQGCFVGLDPLNFPEVWNVFFHTSQQDDAYPLAKK